MPADLTRAALEALDRADDLAPFRAEFDLPADVIYLDGNSLGPLPKAAAARVAEVVTREWGTSLIRAWNAHDWIGLPLRIGEKLGRIIGAAPGSTLVADSTSVNLFKLLAAALAAQPKRHVILTETGNFPTDLYVANGLTELLRRGHAVRAVTDPVSALNDDVAVLMLTHVNYRSGAMHDMAAVTRAAHAVGALTLWDLSHSVGAVPLHLADDNVDLAVGCGYKYPEWRPRRTCVPVGCAAFAGGSAIAVDRLVGPCGALRVRARLSTGGRHRTRNGRHAAGAEPRGP